MGHPALICIHVLRSNKMYNVERQLKRKKPGRQRIKEEKGLQESDGLTGYFKFKKLKSSNTTRTGNFLRLNSLVRSDKCNVYFTCPNHKTTCPKNPT